MKEFFKQELKSLELKTGYKQYERLLEKSTWEKDLNELVAILCRVCDQFPYIPEKDKEQIISQNVITDSEFTGLNARIVFKWLSQARGIYFKEESHQQAKPDENYKILEGEERQKKLQEWLDSLGDGMKSVPQLSSEEIKSHGKIDVLEKVAVSTDYQPREGYAEQVERHRQYVKENYNLIDGKPLPTWISEDEWIKKQNSENGTA